MTNAGKIASGVPENQRSVPPDPPETGAYRDPARLENPGLLPYPSALLRQLGIQPFRPQS